MPRIVLIYTACAVLCCALHSAAHAATLSPEQTVAAVQEALDKADEARLDELMDVNGVIGQGADIFLERARTPEGQADLPPFLAMTLSSIESSPQGRLIARGLLQKAAEEFVRFGVRSGSFGGKGRETPKSKNMWSALFEGASLGRKEIQQVGKAVPEGGGVYVPCIVFDHGSQRVYIVEAALTKNASGVWRITAIRNMNDLMDQVRQESRAL